MRVVLDTNVIVSGMLNPFGIPGEIVRLSASGFLTICYDVRILSEYRRVLLRPVFDFDIKDVEDYLDYIKFAGRSIPTHPLSHKLPDPFDEPFLAVAASGSVEYLITGNIKHFPAKLCLGIEVVSPKQFLDVYRRTQ